MSYFTNVICISSRHGAIYDELVLDYCPMLCKMAYFESRFDLRFDELSKNMSEEMVRDTLNLSSRRTRQSSIRREHYFEMLLRDPIGKVCGTQLAEIWQNI